MNTMLRSALAAVALTGVLGVSTALPARADSAATTRTILGILAGVAAVATIENVDHKRAVASTLEGYTQDGAAVYGDGRVVEPNGNSWYPGNNGLSISCDGNGGCSIYRQ